MADSESKAKSGGCPYHKAKAAAVEETPATTHDTDAKPEATPAPAKKCPYSAGAAASTAGAGAGATAGAGQSGPDVHATDAPENAPDAIKKHFETSYNAVAARATEKVTPERLALARATMTKLGYSEADLTDIGEEVVLMQGVGCPHPWGAYKKGDTVLDIGCGFGVDTRLAAKRVGPTGRAFGLDLSAGEVMAALNVTKTSGVRNADFRVGDMEALPFEDNSLNCVMSNGGFCLVLNKNVAFGEILRVLAPGGRIAICCTTKKNKKLPDGVRWPVCMNTFIPIDEIEPLLTELGFEDVKVDTSNSLMNASEMKDDDTDLKAAAAAAGTCVHAVKAQMRRRKEAAKKAAISGSEKPTVHSGQAQFNHLKNFDMNELCARVVILARKPVAGGAGAASSAGVCPVTSAGKKDSGSSIFSPTSLLVHAGVAGALIGAGLLAGRRLK